MVFAPFPFLLPFPKTHPLGSEVMASTLLAYSQTQANRHLLGVTERKSHSSRGGIQSVFIAGVLDGSGETICVVFIVAGIWRFNLTIQIMERRVYANNPDFLLDEMSDAQVIELQFAKVCSNMPNHLTPHRGTTSDAAGVRNSLRVIDG